MTVHVPPEAIGTERFLQAHRSKDVLRFITCGSVDDGKSTLIGRLLHDTKQLFDDQLVVLTRDSRKHGTQGGDLDFALLLDGLSAEREQGITIDVAYRFFSTAKRTFIVADTPGHEQYTRNMATGASTANLAILLVDARKGLSRQTRRHSLLVSLLGIRHVVLAINKMDLVGWSQGTYERILSDYRHAAAELPSTDVTAIPLSALNGDNVVQPAAAAPWYTGPTLLQCLEDADAPLVSENSPFRLSVQGVSRPDSDFRGFAGLVSSGSVRPGMPIRVLPGGQTTHVERIVTFDGDLDHAVSGQAVTLTLDDAVDVSRGDLIVSVDEPPAVSDVIAARLFWTGGDSLRPGDSFLLKIGALTVGARVAEVRERLDLDRLRSIGAAHLNENDIGAVVLQLDRAIPFDPYERNRETGGFVLIDRHTYDTVAMGLVLGDHVAGCADALSTNETLGAAREKPWRSLLKAVSWRVTGTLDTMVLAFLFTRDFKISAAIGATEILTKIALYYGHERVWARLPFGLSRR